MKALLSILLLGCYVLQCSANCVTCDYGVLAETPLAERYKDNLTLAEDQLTRLIAAGFTGINSTMACDTHQVCGSNSSCQTVSTNVYRCSCDQYFQSVPDFESFSCTDIDECSSSSTNNCSANADCTNESPGFSCACKTGYTGDGVNCTDFSECASNPCVANATCDEPQVDNYTCTCIPGYTGDAYSGNCTDISECDSNPCATNATCDEPQIDNYTCTCITGYTGDAYSGSCTDISECDSNPCVANATCDEPQVDNYTCACIPGYTGEAYSGNCTDISECDSNPCVTNATCDEPQVDNYTCTCVAGYTGDAYSGSCTDTDECSASNLNDCHDNATCTNLDTTYNCTCDAGFSGNGTHCEDIDECASNPCANHATCNQPVADNYTCTCNYGFAGDGYSSCIRGRQMINITFIITCTGLNFDSALTDNATDLYANVTAALRSALDTFSTTVDSQSNVDNATTYTFTNSTDGRGSAQAEITMFIDNTDVLESDFLKRVNEISETVECNAVASTDECGLAIDQCDSGRTCENTDYGYCCYHDMSYTASVTLNATYNASIHGDITSTESQDICNAVQDLVQRFLDAKETRGCTQSITFDCEKLLSGSVEAVLKLAIVNATYTAEDIADELRKAINETTSFGTVIGAGDFDECSSQYEAERNCSAFADCLNFAGNFSCECNATYYDNGTAPGEICISPVTVNCSSSDISISILSNYYTNQGINLTVLHLADENCNYSTHAQIVGDSIEFTVSINECNTTLSTSADNTTVIASNFISNLPSSGPFTGTEINVPFQCELPASLNISAQFNGNVHQVNLPNVAATGGFSLDFSMYDSTFTNAYGSSKTFSSNEIIYGQISISNSIDDVSVNMERCWGTPTANSGDSQFLEYLTNGCSNGQTTNFNLIANGDGSARFSFQMFFFTQVNSVYLHCEVQVCTPSCISTCPSKRRRRQAVERTEEVTITVLLKLNPNDPIFQNWTGPTSNSGSDVNDITLPIVSAILAFFLIVLLALLVIVAVRKRKASKENYDMTHVNMHAIGVKPPEY